MSHNNNKKEVNDLSGDGYDKSLSLRTHQTTITEVLKATGIDEVNEAIRSIIDFFLNYIQINPLAFASYRKLRNDEYISVSDAKAILHEFGIKREVRAIQYWCDRAKFGEVLKARKFPNEEGYWQISMNGLLSLIRDFLIERPSTTQ